MATSSQPADSIKYFTNLDHGGTFILHNFQDEEILVESDAGILVFLRESDVRSRQMDPRQYHWHCIPKDDHFHFRNAFSKKMLQVKIDSLIGDSEGDFGDMVVTGKFNKKQGKFFVSNEVDGPFTLYHAFQGRLCAISAGYEHHLEIKYPKIFWEIKEDAVVHWKFEPVYDAVNYNRDVYEL